MNARTTRGRFALACAGTAGSIALISKAKAAQFDWKAGNDAPPDHPESIAHRQLWDAVREESGGRLDVKVFPAGQLGGAASMLTQLRAGAIQFYVGSGVVLSAITPVAGVDVIAFAFKSSQDAWRTFDGPLGDYIRKEVASKGILILGGIWQVGMRHVTSASKQIRNASDLQGFKIRTPPSPIVVDCFRTLGASPATIDITETYVALQTHVVDGEENPFAIIETWKFYEVQKYLTLTNHQWGGKWLLGNPETFNTLPSDIQAIVQRNALKYAVVERIAVQKLDDTLQAKLATQGMTILQGNPASFKAKLGPYYAKWKSEFGNTAWTMLEDKVGKLA